MKRKGNCGYIPVKKNFYFIEKIEEKLYKLPLMKQMLQNKVDITFQANKYIYHPNKKMRKKTIQKKIVEIKLECTYAGPPQ